MGKIKDFFEKKRYSLKFSMVFYYIIIFVVFIMGFEVFTFYSLISYYYNNMKLNMLSQSQYSVELYESSLSQYSLSDIILNERFEFLNNMQGQVQILDNTGVLYFDNTGSDKVGEIIQPIENLNGRYFEFNSNNTLSLNYPITINGRQIGVLRSISSLDATNVEIYYRMLIFLLFGLFVILTGTLSIYYLSGRIFKPINSLTVFANKLSNGQYKEKSNMAYEGEIGELAQVMDEMSENIINKEQIKTEFISSVSHELRTPLTSIKGWAITLQDGNIEQEMLEEGLKIIEKESDRLSDMVEDLLDFSRFTSPKFNLTKTEFNIIPIIKNIINQLKPRTQEKSISMILDYDKENISIIADENRLKQVFINLIDNAIKFTLEDGNIIVSVKDLGDKVQCEVIDTGIGIKEDEIELVTTKFYKGTTSGSHTGLGLSICEEIILLHNGELYIKSKEGQGTTVGFELPKGVKIEEN